MPSHYKFRRRRLHDDGLWKAGMRSSLKVSRTDFRSSSSFHSSSVLKLPSFTASFSVLNLNLNLSKSVCSLTNPSEATCLRQSIEFFSSLYMLSSPLFAEAAMTSSVCEELDPRFGFLRFLPPKAAKYTSALWHNRFRAAEAGKFDLKVAISLSSSPRNWLLRNLVPNFPTNFATRRRKVMRNRL